MENYEISYVKKMFHKQTSTLQKVRIWQKDTLKLPDLIAFMQESEKRTLSNPVSRLSKFLYGF